MNRQFLSYLELLLAQFCIAVSITTAKYIANNMPTQLLLGYRFFIACSLIAVFVLVFHKGAAFKELRNLTKLDILKLSAQAACAGFLFNFFLLWGLSYTSATRAGIISSFTPVCIVLLSIIILKERFKFKQGIALAIAVVGLLLIAYEPEVRITSISNSLLGDILVLAAVAPEALFTVLAKLHPVKISATAKTLVVHLVNFILVIPSSIFVVLNSGWHFQTHLLPAILLFTITSVLFYVFWYRGLIKVSGTNAGLCTTFMPIATALLANIFLLEHITSYEIIGIILAIFSIILTIL